MISNQYKIALPSDYDMNIIRNRIIKNGFKTDGFPGLKFKLYLITINNEYNNIQNSYAPLYVWKNSEGLNKFLFEGFFDNILNSFGWQEVSIGIPIIDTTSNKIKECKYLLERTQKIEPRSSLKGFKEQLIEESRLAGCECLVIYNPDKWTYCSFYFLDDLKLFESKPGKIYQILHVSM